MKFDRLCIRCKTYENGIETYNLKHFQIIEPQNEKEFKETLNQNLPTYIDAMLYMPCARYEFLDSSIFQNIQKKTFDWLGLDIYGKIISINKNVKPNQKICLDKNTFAVIIFKQDIPEKSNLHIDDWVIYKNFIAPNTKFYS